MASQAIVENFNVFKNVSLGLHAGEIMTLMDQLSFQGAKETFHGSIVVAIALAAHTSLNLIFGQPMAIILAGILTAPIRMMQQARRWLPGFQSQTQGSQHQLPFQAFSHSPADNPARVQIQNRRQIQPAFGRRDEGEVGQPFLVGLLGDKVSVKQMGRNRLVGVTVGGDYLEFTALFGAQSNLAHQPGHPLVAALDPIFSQFDLNTDAAVGLAAFLMNDFNLLGQALIGHLARADRAFAPGLVATARNPPHPPHQRDLKFLTVISHELIFHRWLRLKMAKAFFKISRSCRRTLFSWRNGRRSASVAVKRPWPRNAS